jgi:hypothetical protein
LLALVLLFFCSIALLYRELQSYNRDSLRGIFINILNLEVLQMTKSENKQVAMLEVYIANGMTDIASRSLSALIRSAMSNKSKSELMALAVSLNLVGNADFIV